MAKILLHKQVLTEEQASRLAAEGVITIQTDEPKDFKFLDVEVPQIEMNDMVWALLDAANTEGINAGDIRRKLIRNLAELATEKRTLKAAEPSQPEGMERSK